MPSTPRTRRPASRRAVALASAATAVGSLAFAPAALASADTIVARGAGLTAPTGVVETPDGARWVADELLGICRVDASGAKAVLEDLYCSDAEAGAPHVGPISSAGLVFDADSSNFYAGDIQSNFGSVWRLHWDADTGKIDSATQLVSLADDRVTGVALAPGAYGASASVVYVTKRSAAVMEIKDAARTRSTPTPVGFARQESPTGIAVLDGDAYLAEGNSVTRIALAGGPRRIAETVPGTNGVAATALTADTASGRVYAGTSYPELTDDVLVVDPVADVTETYERGFAAVTGLGVGADGTLLVADDPGAAAGNIDSMSQGRLFEVRRHAIGRGRVTVTAAPPAWSALSSVTFGYNGSAHARFECSLDGGDWVECPGYESGQVTFDDLAEGAHTFEVRATTDAGTGEPVRRVFVIDRTAPTVRIVAPAAGSELLEGTGRVEMTADERWVSFSCSIDESDFADCEPGQALPALSLGEHTLRVVGVDAAGNRSAAAAGFSVVAPPPVVVTPVEQPEAPVSVPAPKPTTAAPSSPSSPSTPSTPSTPASSAAEETQVEAAVLPVATAALPAVQAPAFVPRGAVAGVKVAAPPRLSALRLRPRWVIGKPHTRTLRLMFRAGAGARVAHVTIRNLNGAKRTVVVRAVRVRPGVSNRLSLHLTRRETARIRPGRWLLSVSLSGVSGARGEAESEVLRVTAR
jgi:hypothetical protein